MTAKSAHDVEQASERSSGHGGRPGLNWLLALLTIPGAAAVVGYAYLQVLGTAACTPAACAGIGPSETVFGLITYGTPVVAVAAVVLSFVTAKRRNGWIVPAVAWAVIAVAAITLLVTF
ncbi:MAG: hypothetical protein ABW137_23330 [Mycobacterium sp.]